jgi:glycosyltransferase involved in cell wall biosynthesis
MHFPHTGDRDLTKICKVAFVTAFPRDLDSPRGGVESVSVNLVDALMEHEDLDLHVVTTQAGVPIDSPPSTAKWKRATIHRLPQQAARVLVDATGPGRRQMHNYLRRLAPDVIHAHDVYGVMVKGLDVPRVHTIHGFIHGDTLVAAERFAGIRSRIWKRVETAAWSDQPHIISISPYVRERLNGVATGVIHDIENPIAPAFFDVRRRENGFTIFSAAVICQRKNTLMLVEAFAKVVQAGFDARLRLAGHVVEPEYAALVDARIRQLGLDARIARLGSIGAEDVRRELSSATLFALVSLEENAPLGIEEAMAAGVPVVTSNRCGMPYLVRHGETGWLVNPLDPDDIARRICQLFDDGARRRVMSETASRIAKERFHPAAVARRTREVYYEAIGRDHADDAALAIERRAVS